MRAAVVLHLYYPEVALELLERLARLSTLPQVIATHVGPLDEQVRAALDRLPAGVRTLEVPNGGWDVAPLFHALPLLRERGVDLVCKLHTKKGASGYAAEWRELFYRGLVDSDAQVAAILAAFEADPALEIAGPRALYKSAAAHQFRNAELLSALGPRLTAPTYPPADWGFFAGTMFWARRELIERVEPLADFTDEEGARDGAMGHALERLFGLAPIATGGSVGLVEGETIEVVPAPGIPSPEPIIRTLVAEAERSVAPIDRELSALITAHNPLVDYIRTGGREGALDPHPLFSSGWYREIHADVTAAGVHPLQHYIGHGAIEGRSTGPLFDGAYYRQAYPDVPRDGDPLRHFIAIGQAEGRSAIPVSRPQYETEDERPRRFYRQFDVSAEAAFLRRMADLPLDVAARADETLVSVVMPAFNRAETIGASIRSVLAQTHARFELIVVDDGSTDDTVDIVEGFRDPRIRLVRGDHGGVSAARNLGLDAATGEIVAYLDSDNRWKAWFLEVMVRFMRDGGFDAAYSGIALRDDLGQLTGYRGDVFDWEACLQQNYVDLNAFCHSRALLDQVGRFDTNLRRMVDWDLILRIGKDRPVGYAPFVGCDYFDGRADANRITVGEPSAFLKLVHAKNRRGLATGTPKFAAAVRLSFAIKIAAPEAEKAAWGDWHFAESLKEAIERQGHECHIDFRGAWGGRPVSQEDVVIVLRGLLPYEPRPGQMSFLWNISHPDQVPLEEYDRYSRVYVASASAAALLDPLVKPPVTALLQATDPARFHLVEGAAEGPPVLFCGNSRGVEREIVRWAIEADRAPAIYGGGWEGLVPPELAKAETVDNRALGALYAGAGAVLNDHWPSMAAFGFLSNRLFDIVAAGGAAVSDPVPSMCQVFGDAVRQVSGPAALAAAVDAAVAEPASTRTAAARRILDRHSFDHRARRLIGDAFHMLGLPVADLPAETDAPALRIHIIAPHGPHGPQSSATIRLLAPLTDESLGGRTAVSIGRAADPVPPCDVCIVQRTAFQTEAAIPPLVRTLGEMGAVLVTDVDDAFNLMDEHHPEAAVYRPLSAVMERVMASAAETWFSTPKLAEAYAGAAYNRIVIPNGIDPRIWRDWRHPRPAPFVGGKLRILCMGTATHAGDFGGMRPGLERLWAERPGSFEVTLIGVDPDAPPGPYLTRLSPPAEAIPYARFVRWLRDQGPFDVGLAPLIHTPFNHAKSDIKLLDYLALGILPVVSDCPAYRADAETAEHAVLVENLVECWYEALIRIMDDPAAARAKALAGHDFVWQRRTTARTGAMMFDRLMALSGKR